MPTKTISKVKSIGTIIGKTKLSETSLIVKWCTETSGIIQTVAKGARKPKSPFAGQLDLFYQCDIEVFPARKGDLHTLKELVVLNSRHGLQSSYWQTLAAAYFVKLISKIVEPQTPIPELNDLLNRGLDYLCENEVDLKAIQHFERQAVEFMGINTPGQLAIDSLRDNHVFIPKIRLELMKKLS